MPRRGQNSRPPFVPQDYTQADWNTFQEEIVHDKELLLKDNSQLASRYTRHLTWMVAVEQHLGPYEDPDEFVCRQEADNLVDSAQCADCPLSTQCFTITEADLLDAERKLTEGMS